MKKFFLLAAAALVALTACTKIDDVTSTPDVKIGYQVATFLNQTKANTDTHGHTSLIDELAELGIDSDQSFASKAYIHAAQSDGTVAAPESFFNAATDGIETVKYASSQWAPSHTYYWPKAANSSLSFFSWYDFSGANPAISYSTDGGAASLTWTDRTVALKDNVLYADAAYHYKNNGTAVHGLNSVSEGVPTLFHHALAKVRFTVKASQTEKADTKNSGFKTFWKVTLSEVALSSGTIKNNGNLVLNQTSATDATTQRGWTLPTNSIWTAPTSTQTYLTDNLGNASGGIFDTDVARGTTALTTTAVALSGANFMNDTYFTVLPQEVANNVTLTFKYTIETRYGDGTFDNARVVSTEVVNVTELVGTAAYYTANGIKLNAIGDTTIPRWEMNHRYVYNIIINPETSTILYDPAIEDWAAETGATVTVPTV